MNASKLYEGIALLIELAERGEIDPWDVQVIEVIDRYLSQLVLTEEAYPGAGEADLSQSGQAFLSASMLVLFKANTLVEMVESPTSDPGAADTLPETEDGFQARLRLPLERQLQRRPAALPPQKRRVTLKELIDQLQLMATVLQQQEALNATKTTRPRRLSTHARATQAGREIAQLAHQENLTEVAAQLEQFLNQNSHLILSSEQDWLNMEHLVELWTQTAATVAVATFDGNQAKADATQRNDRVSVFWALLLLSAQSKVELAQEEFYQDIKIRPWGKWGVSGFSDDMRIELTDDQISIE